MNLGLSIIYIRKITMYKYWDNYAKPKYGDKAKICYVDKDSFIVNAKSEDVYDDFAEKVEQ